MKSFLFLLLSIPFFPTASLAAEPVPGLGRPEVYASWLAGKKVALVANQASLFEGSHAIDFLRGQKVNLVKLFALEHGVRGKGGAGEEIGDSIDEETGIPIISLYGKDKKPTPQKLAGVDVIVFDIQDVGVRFFTYISSLGLILEAAAEQRIPVVVFDRPNPNGDYIDGPILKSENKSFVGPFPIPLVYGLTIGELAQMIHGEKWHHTVGLNLHVVAMSGYDHSTVIAPEGNPSPGLRTLHAMRIYPSIALFEPSIMGIGRGTEHPFTQYGIPLEKIGKHSYVPDFEENAHNKVYDGETCYGEEFYSRSIEKVPPFTTDIFVKAMQKVKRRPFLTNPRFLELLVGDKSVVDQMLRGRPYKEIRAGFQRELEKFKVKRKKYLLYK